MRLQKNSALALYSVLEFVADPTRHIPAAEIAAKYGVSPHHLAKVLSELARSGLVESVRGVGGGYRFAGNARRVTLMDVIQLFEDFSAPPAERHERSESTPVGMGLGRVLYEIDEIAKATLGSITLATMLRLIERQQAKADRSAEADGEGARRRAADAANPPNAPSRRSRARKVAAPGAAAIAPTTAPSRGRG